MRTRTLLALAIGTTLSGLAVAAEPQASTIGEAITAGSTHVSFRLRYEGVDDDALVLGASALTLRSRLTWQSASVDGFSAVAEVDDVRAPVENYNSTANGRTNRPTVADPTGTDINRIALQWKSGGTELAIGRQRIALDNQRFIGSVGWRQNEQTFDGFTAKTVISKRLELSYGYIYNVDRVYGPDDGSQAAEWHGRVHLLHARYDAGAAGTITAFSYLMDFHNAAAQSNATTGLSWTGAPAIAEGWTLPFAASYAYQGDYGNAPTRYAAHYVQAEAGVARKSVTFKVGREVLSGDATRSGHRFQTPLATLHAFQGWADKFLTTPPKGIEDTYVTLSDRIQRVTLQVAWHDFRADATSQRYGTEWNAQASVPFGGRYEALLKFADYRADGYSTSARKVWAMLSAAF